MNGGKFRPGAPTLRAQLQACLVSAQTNVLRASQGERQIVRGKANDAEAALALPCAPRHSNVLFISAECTREVHKYDEAAFNAAPSGLGLSLMKSGVLFVED